MSDHLQTETLFRSPLITISDVRCRPHCGGCGAEEQPSGHLMVFPRTGVFVKECTGKEAIVADPTLLLFFNVDETYRIAHPVPGGDDCTVLRFEEDALLRFLQEDDRVAATSRGRPFPVPTAATSSAMILALQRLRQALRMIHRPNPLAVEEASVQLLAEGTRVAAQQRGVPAKRMREETRRAHRTLARAARVFLARTLREKVTLEDIARAIFSSPFHLARVFRRETGMSLHAQLNQLRLRHALDHIADGAQDLTTLALQLGFSSHAHFTLAFGREFRQPPSEIRRRLSSAMLRKMSRNLET